MQQHSNLDVRNEDFETESEEQMKKQPRIDYIRRKLPREGDGPELTATTNLQPPLATKHNGLS